jgi:hypothetical protein
MRQTNGTYFYGVNKKNRKEVLIWRFCFMVSQGGKNTLEQIQEKMVWSIQGIILLTKYYCYSCFY